jgi:3-oxo-5-alpha-steroid 4-dehydrogenase 1
VYPAGPTEQTLFWGLVIALLAVGTLIFGTLLVITAPYGRHSRGGWGPSISSRAAWIFMESPSVILFVAVFSVGRNAGELVPLILLVVWQLHYFHRAFIYPLQTYRDNSNRTALAVACMGFVFNLANAYVNARWISELSAQYDTAWLTDPRFVLGLAVFGYGYYTNRWADGVLRRLKAEGRGYQIPRGGWYERISCPNYFGELLEWAGWALATWSWAGFAFMWFTAANLVPRALANHRWYRDKFPQYPAERRAVIPGVL